jgi:hypothetical protein
MADMPSDQESCTPQPLPEGPPTAEWTPEQLTTYARAQDEIIVQGERMLAANYWRLGAALNLLRPIYKHFRWEPFLAVLRLDKTRASRARAIARTFSNEADVAQLTVREAYDRRTRKLKRETKTAKAGCKHDAKRLSKFLDFVGKTAELFIDEAGFAEQAIATALLPEVEMAIGKLQQIRDLLHEQSRKS